MDTAERKEHLDKIVSLDPVTKYWSCQICNQSVSRKTIAIDHIERKHIRLLFYPCQYCDQSFTCSGLRRTHTHTHHREQNRMAKYLTESLIDVNQE